MDDPTSLLDTKPPNACSICDEPSPELKPRLWFRSWMYMAQGLPPVERQWLCPACAAAERRQSLWFGAIVFGALVVAVVVVVVALYAFL